MGASWCRNCQQFYANCVCDESSCPDCGALGSHFCPGPDRKIAIIEAMERKIDRKIFEMLDDRGTFRCKKHPKYQAKRRPRTACEACWRRWISLNPG